MSPTSYQAAPPRTTTIAEQRNSVKLVIYGLACPVCSSSKIRLPGRIRSSVAPAYLATRMHVVNTRAGLIGAQHGIPDMRDPIFFLANRVDRNLPQVVSVHQVVKRLRSLLLIQRVIIDGLAHRLQVLLQHRFPGALNGFVVHDCGHANEDRDDHHHNHQLNQRKSARLPAIQLPGPLAAFRAYQTRHSVTFTRQPTNLNTSCRPMPCRKISSKHRTHSSRPNSWSPDRPEPSACPIPGGLSSGPLERAAGSAYFSLLRQSLPRPRPSPAYPDPADTLRSQARREFSAGPPGPYTCQSRPAFPASPAAIPFRARESR